ncbi:MAG: HupE/UreJ family protein [Sideroxyarcus sp.]|nr:HupE/UreJ family protein [Sideroxyarcus sp.]
MKQNSQYIASLLALFTLLFPILAQAHIGVGVPHGFLSGLGHPFSGFDHLAAMIAVGLWAAQQGGRAIWMVPLSFVSVMAVSGLLSMFAAPIPFIEGGITLSLLVLGLLIAAAIRLPVLASTAIVGVFAVFHGYAHGSEMPQHTDSLTYAAGFILATALLHLSGIGMAVFARKHSHAPWLRFAGTAVILLGGISWFGY